MNSIFKKEDHSRFSLAIRIISAILVIAFLAQGIAWAHPDKLQISLKTAQEDFKPAFYVKCLVVKANHISEFIDTNTPSLTLDNIEKWRRSTDKELSSSEFLPGNNAPEILIKVDKTGDALLRYCPKGREEFIPEGYISVSYWGLDKEYAAQGLVRQFLFSERLHRRLVSTFKALPEPLPVVGEPGAQSILDLHKDASASFDPIRMLTKIWHSRKFRLAVIYAIVFTAICADISLHNAIEVVLIMAVPFLLIHLLISKIYDHMKGKKAEDRAYYKERSKKALRTARLYALLFMASLPGPLTREPLFMDIGLYDRAYFGSDVRIGFDASLGDLLTIGTSVFGVFAIWHLARYVRARKNMSEADQGTGAAEGEGTPRYDASQAERAAKLKAAWHAMWLRRVLGLIFLAVFVGFNFIKFTLADAGSLPYDWAVLYGNIIYPSSWAFLYLSIIFFNSALSYYMDYRKLRKEGDGGHFSKPPSQAPSGPAALPDSVPGSQGGPAQVDEPIAPPEPAKGPSASANMAKTPAAPAPESAAGAEQHEDPLAVFSSRTEELGKILLEDTASINNLSGSTLILYADSMLEQGAAADFARVSSETQILDNSTILIYSRDPAYGKLFAKIVDDANSGKDEGNKIKPIFVNSQDLKGYNEWSAIEVSIPDEAKELECLIRYARALSLNNNGRLLGVVKGATNSDYKQEVAKVAAYEHVAVALFRSNNEDEVYSFKEALEALLAIKNDDTGPSEKIWFRELPPADREDIEKVFRDYIMALGIARNA